MNDIIITKVLIELQMLRALRPILSSPQKVSLNNTHVLQHFTAVAYGTTSQ